MKTSSVEFISRSPNPLPMKSNYRRFVLLGKSSSLAVETKEKKRNRFEQTSELYREGKYRCVQPKINLLKDVLPVKNNVFLWNLPDVERGAFT
ncbi:hypothetical protein TNCV_1406671 [Trichonephila clavipes]|nr:hypothetical protein TNCV_1406671 [Trichonephila clavipes]